MTEILTAFYSDHDRPAFKVYDHGTDWQVIGHQYERWYSVWQHDRQGSLERALSDIPNLDRPAVVFIRSEQC